jgi:hypothetical protein
MEGLERADGANRTHRADSDATRSVALLRASPLLQPVRTLLL